MILCVHSLWENLNLQKDALIKYGVDERNIFSDKTSGSKDKRVGLDKAIEFLGLIKKNGVWKVKLASILWLFKKDYLQMSVKKQ